MRAIISAVIHRMESEDRRTVVQAMTAFMERLVMYIESSIIPFDMSSFCFVCVTYSVYCMVY